ncbi:hypothetical protein ESY86_16345 [Subsaximicrobium wynnwilliamsii]|uniref:Uncharacterized protein n=1 Tax=Subsaximicrobium wynnwilliamsii TaxID=291179 RepID=A0A5C6ZEM7_9FLAO|nr:hypothetical protein [Subsaximicrobium wynnwilliamsii]TXD81776.1 hypothetical protein ESY87_16840 [Subsaximicrobium wynnwilliamsii]TXD87602.1 hypothetical protein ESY86_16345 [Subsaximicrobium wynnwilliamsii]TXE01275.1 hypothetical protein ESY88_16595 [Subsaximicrobium wynnwilliamsii]
MDYHIIINDVKTVEQLDDAWNDQDYRALLSELGLEDTKDSKTQELWELLLMALSELEPNEAAALVLKYRMSDALNENQIEQLSHEMQLDKISEEYPNIGLHHELFNVNQLLFKAYNGTFPNAKATIVEFDMTPKQKNAEAVTKEHIVKAFDKTLYKGSVIKRLFSNHIAGEEAFDEAEDIIWTLEDKGNNHYKLVTSEYWMSKDDFTEAEFDAKVIEFEEEEVD